MRCFVRGSGCMGSNGMDSMRYAIIAFILFVLGIVTVAVAGSKEQYLENGITVAYTKDARPLSFMGTSGRPEGLTIDFWRLWSNKTGIPVRFKLGVWEETIPLVTDGGADVHGGLVKTEERQQLFDYTHPLFDIETVLVVKPGQKGNVESDFKAGTVGAVKEAHSAQLVLDRFPDVQLSEYLTPQALLEAFVRGEVDGAVVYLPTFHLKNNQRAEPVEYRVAAILETLQIHGAVRKGNTELLGVINDGLAQITKEERDYLKNRWFVPGAEEQSHSFLWLWLSGAVFLVGAVFLALKIALRTRK
ncbi:MAG: hypothetical protein CL942_02790 [Desulfovibrio sp.]|nr:hypothetical protein [Desulfovibrio sp.]